MLAITREVPGVGMATLEAFADGKSDLSAAMLQKLTKVLYPHSEYDVASGKLCSSNKAPARSYIHPPRFDPKSSP